ncbi:MAG: adenylate/guanylate cyclase domain-containing protein [Candidatus Rifleibacteriota bacterium]
MENRLMTIMFLDMQGYTKRSAKQTIEEMKLFHDQMQKFVTDVIERWSGIMVKTLGDGFLVRFESPTNAVQAGIEIQRKLEARNAQMMNPDSLVRFRIGINTGEVGLDESGDLFGDPVNIASRIQTFADTNDVFISESTFLAMNRNEFGAVDLGSQELKNATREIRIYKVLKNGAPGKIDTHKTAEKSKVKYVAIGLLVILLFGIVRGVIKKAAAKKKPAQNVTEQSRNDPQTHGESPGSGVDSGPDANAQDHEKTILDISAEDPRLKFSPDEAGAFLQLKRLRQEKNFGEAEKICGTMISSQPGPKKVPWALMLTELFYEQGKTKDAEKLVSNIFTKAPMPEQAKKRLAEQVERIKRKYQK